MPMNFPDTPVLDDEFIVSRERSYTYDGEKWMFASARLTVITVTSIDPIVIGLSDPPAPFSVFGTGFTANAVVYLDGTTVPTNFVSATELTFQVDPAALGLDLHYIRVQDGAGISQGLWFEVLNHPQLGNINPSSLPAGGPTQLVTVNGMYFSSNQNYTAQLFFDGVGVPSFLSSTQTISADFTPPGAPTTIAVTVRCGPVNSLDPDLTLTIT